jgi:hypothetical protein
MGHVGESYEFLDARLLTFFDPLSTSVRSLLIVFISFFNNTLSLSIKIMSIQNVCESPPWMMSPSNSGHNSDHNSYGSPALSPGQWNVQSPVEGMWNVTSPQSASNTASSPSSGSTTTHHFIGLPKDLGKSSDRIAKNELDIRRQKIAEAKAQKLLQRSIWAGDPSSPGSGRTPASPLGSSCSDMDDNGLAIRKEAKRVYKEKKRITKIAAYTNGGVVPVSPSSSASSSDYTTRSVSSSHPTTRIITRPKKECLATSTRKKKVVPPGEDVESINDYKSILDIEREKEAERHALYLLKKFGM